MRKIFIIFFLCAMVLVLSGNVSYAWPVTTNNSSVDITVYPLTTAYWDYRGVVVERPWLGDGIAYYNKYLSPALVSVDKKYTENRRAHVGCVNWALGEIMHTLKYPNPVSCDNNEKLNHRKEFIVYETPSIGYGQSIKYYKQMIYRRFISPEFYDWEKMATVTSYSYAESLNMILARLWEPNIGLTFQAKTLAEV